jgi:3'(2'), 5'-bisphosphate nucleotidase
MLGLVDGNDPVFGVVYIPAKNILYFGGPACGSYRMNAAREIVRLQVPALADKAAVKTLISKNDLNKNMWAAEIPGIEIETASSIGLDVHEVLQSSSDVFVHIRPTLKAWDTAAPAAVALGAGLEIGTELGFGFEYPHNHANHDGCIVVGRKGSVNWWKSAYESYCPAVSAAGAGKVLAGCC